MKFDPMHATFGVKCCTECESTRLSVEDSDEETWARVACDDCGELIEVTA